MENTSFDPFEDEKPEKTESVGVEFKPSGAQKNTAALPDFQEFDESAIFSMAEEKFNAAIESGRAASLAVDIPAQPTPAPNVTEAMPPEMISISAAMYVEFLEAIVNIAGKMFSGTDNSYDFEKSLKKRYEKVSEIYFKQANIQVTPGQFFVIMTFIVLGASIFRAYKDRSNRIKVEQFRKKQEAKAASMPSGQLDMFDGFDVPPPTQSTLRKSYELDDEGFFATTPTGKYAKKAERTRPEPETAAFLKDFYNKNGRFPKPNEVKVMAYA